VTEAHQIRLDPDPLEPYFLSQGFRVGDLVIVSGQAALDERGNVVGVGDFDAQAEQVFRNLARVLEAGGSSLDRVVKVTIFLTDMGNFGKIVELRQRWFYAALPGGHHRRGQSARSVRARDRDRGDGNRRIRSIRRSRPLPSKQTTTSSAPCAPAPADSCSRTRRRPTSSAPYGPSPPASRCSRPRSPAG